MLNLCCDQPLQRLNLLELPLSPHPQHLEREVLMHLPEGRNQLQVLRLRAWQYQLPLGHSNPRDCVCVARGSSLVWSTALTLGVGLILGRATVLLRVDFSPAERGDLKLTWGSCPFQRRLFKDRPFCAGLDRPFYWA